MRNHVRAHALALVHDRMQANTDTEAHACHRHVCLQVLVDCKVYWALVEKASKNKEDFNQDFKDVATERIFTIIPTRAVLTSWDQSWLVHCL